MSSDRKIPVYFPRADNNISDEKYLYPRAAIHTAVQLSKQMFKKRICSALELSIGWGNLIQENNLNTCVIMVYLDDTFGCGGKPLYNGCEKLASLQRETKSLLNILHYVNSRHYNIIVNLRAAMGTHVYCAP